MTAKAKAAEARGVQTLRAELSPDELRNLKVLAARNGRTVQAEAGRALRAYIEKEAAR